LSRAPPVAIREGLNTDCSGQVIRPVIEHANSNRQGLHGAHNRRLSRLPERPHPGAHVRRSRRSLESPVANDSFNRNARCQAPFLSLTACVSTSVPDPLPTFVSRKGDDGPCPLAAIKAARDQRRSFWWEANVDSRGQV
jgi:hypothetical protein